GPRSGSREFLPAGPLERENLSFRGRRQCLYQMRWRPRRLAGHMQDRRGRSKEDGHHAVERAQVTSPCRGTADEWKPWPAEMMTGWWNASGTPFATRSCWTAP